MSAARYSLRRRLSGFTVGAVAVIWLVSAAVSFDLAHDEADAIFDSQIAQASDMLLALVGNSDMDYLAHELVEHQFEQSVPFVFEILQYRDGTFRRAGASNGAPPFPVLKDGYTNARFQGQLWRFHSVWNDARTYKVRVGMSESAHEELETRIAVRLLLPILIALPLMLLAIGWAVRRALHPLDTLAQQVADLDPGALAPLASTQRLPDEIAPLVDALNHAIARVDDTLNNERRFTADAAHELRTPLAALKIQAQVASRADEPARRHALDRVTEAVDRMTYLVEQLLTLARLQPETALAHPPVDVAEQAAELCAEMAPRALANQQKLELDAPGRFVLPLPAAWFGSALTNLVSNALRYAGSGATVRVRLYHEAGRQVVRVEDDGPGIAADARSRMLARFARGEQAQDVEGCGLGFSIVARIAEASGGSMQLKAGLPRADGAAGLAVELGWPA